MFYLKGKNIIILMDTSQFLINNYITENDFEKLKNNLYKVGILVKDYPEENLMLLYNRYENKNKQPVELECRSVVIDRVSRNIVCYTCSTPIYNMQALSYLLRNPNNEKKYYECYEGSLLSLFNYNNKWYLSSRRCLDSEKSVVENKSHHSMFIDVIKQDGYNSLEDFTKYLDINYTYHFVLIHHENKNVVNYTKMFGDNYKKLCFIFAREKDTLTEINSEDLITNFLSSNIFLPKKLENAEGFDKINQTCDMTEEPSSEGIVIKSDNVILKLQTIQYQFYKSIGTEKNLYIGFLKLYQTNKLKDYFNNNENSEKYSKIVNPIKTFESFDTIGTIDALFKVCTSELFELYNILWDNNGNHCNTELYNFLPKEYKNILFHLRGIYFKNKKKFAESNKELLTINHVYNHIKNTETHSLQNFLRCRKLMFNWIRKNNTTLTNEFKLSLYKSKKVLYKLSSIYCNKLFPEIMPDDLPV